jgi:hypothetical protein
MGQGSSSDAKTAIRQALRDVWIDDTKRDTCFNCRAAFSIANRRHHCRSCGELFCKKCWGALVALPEEVFPDLSDTCRTPQPVCEACRTVLQLPGRVGKALWSGGIVVRIGATIVKGNPLAAGSDSQSPANNSSPPSPPYPPGDNTPPPPARSTPVLSDDRYLITLERWRPFNRLTCLAVDRVLDEPHTATRPRTSPSLCRSRSAAGWARCTTVRAATRRRTAQRSRAAASRRPPRPASRRSPPRRSPLHLLSCPRRACSNRRVSTSTPSPSATWTIQARVGPTP